MFTLSDILEGTGGRLDEATGAALTMTGQGFTSVAIDSRGKWDVIQEAAGKTDTKGKELRP